MNEVQTVKEIILTVAVVGGTIAALRWLYQLKREVQADRKAERRDIEADVASRYEERANLADTLAGWERKLDQIVGSLRRHRTRTRLLFDEHTRRMDDQEQRIKRLERRSDIGAPAPGDLD